MAVDMPSSNDIENPSDSIDLEKENSDKLLEEKYNLIELKDEPKRTSIGLKTLSEMNGKDNLIIDLESGVIKPKKLSGPEMLFQKYLKTQAKPKHKDTVCMNILSVENGKLENQKVEVRLDKEVELDHSRPGLSHEKLKENLRNQILQQRLEKLKQRFVKSESAELEPEDKDHFPHKKEDSDEDYNPENDNSDEESAQETASDEEDIITENKKKSAGSKFLDEEAVDEDQSENEEESSESESESSEDDESVNVQSKGQKKSRILKAFEDSDDEDTKTKKELETDKINNAQLQNKPNEGEFLRNPKESEDLFSSQATDFTFNEPSVSEDIDANNINVLFDAPSQIIENEDDLMDLCSGQFASTPSDIILTNNDFKFSQNVQANDSQDNSSDFISQVPDRTNKDDSFVTDVPEIIENPPEPLKPTENDPNEIEMTETQKEESNSEVHPIKNINKLLESTDDEANEDVENRKKKLTKRKKKKDKLKKLGFSDDEEESDENVPENNQVTDIDLADEEAMIDESEVELDEPETYVDYDSEENEIQVKLTKKERLKVAKDYFEKEAELSEEEWQSADEDEKGLDNYEIDLADEEEFDQNKLREEVGRIHARKMMDEDAKNLKKIEDLLFENEENDGVGRERKFRWKNQTEGFTMEDENARDADDIDGEQEEENEIMWRRMRHERETLINEQSQKMADSETISTDILLLDQSSQTVTTASTSTLVKRKFQIIKTNSPSIGINLSSENSKLTDSPFLIKAVNTKKFTHSSFLSRDEQTLTKIASFITTKDDEVTNLSSHGGNSMSFAHIDKKEEPSKKRKSEGTPKQENSSGKKRKVENKRFLLDQLK